MELLYLIDRAITRSIQTFSRWVERKLSMNVWFQGLIGMFAMTLIQGSLDNREGDLNLLFHIPYVFFLLSGTLVAGSLMALVLGKLQRFFDPEGYFNPDKEYLDGNRAWGYVVIGISFLFVGIELVDKAQGEGLTLAAGYAFFPNAYEYFANRKKGSGSKKRATATERLRKLLEACKNWLPQPKPTPA